MGGRTNTTGFKKREADVIINEIDFPYCLFKTKLKRLCNSRISEFSLVKYVS